MSKFDTLVDTSEATSTTPCDNSMLDIEEGSRADTASVSTMKGQADQVSRDIAAANVKHIYREDVVRRNDNNMIGVVTEVAGDSDSESDITDDDDEDDNDEDDDDNVDESGGDEDDADDNESENESVTEEDWKDEGDREKQGKGEEESKEESEGVVIGNKLPNKLKNSDDKDDEDREKNDTRRDSLPVDQVRVLWLDDSESKHHFNELTVVDRGFLHGDYVASASNPTGQVGLVIDVSILVDLLALDGSIVRDVPSRDLQRVRDVTVGDYVVLGPWLGRVDDVLDNITVLFDDGSMCKVMKSDPLRLRPLAKNLLEDGHCPYHPGQRVKASSSSVFKNAIWLSGSWKANRLEGTVTKVTVGSVYVHWIASAGYGSESTSTPAEEQSVKNLKLLSCFTHANWQLGDWCLLPSLSSVPSGKGSSKSQLQEIPSEKNAECDSDEVLPDEPIGNIESMDLDQVGSVDENAHVKAALTRPGNNSVSASKDSGHDSSWPLHRKKLRKVVIKREKKPRKKEETFEKALLIVNTKTRVDVAWQDGITQRKLDSTSLIPVESPGDHDFMPEEYVVEKSTDDGDDTSEMRRIGVVKNVNAKEKTACVRWLKQVARPENMREFEKEEIVSVYELEGHQDYDYCYGDVVVRLLPASNLEETTYHDFVEEQSQASGSNSDKCDMKKRSADSKTDAAPAEVASAEFSDLSWVGNITGLRNGDIEVTWADGMVSTVGPQAIYVVGRDDDDASIIAGSEISDAASWETVEDDEMDALDNEEKEPPSASGTDGNPDMEGVSDLEHTSGMNGPLAIPLAAIGFVTRLASGIFSRGRKDDDSISSDISISGDASVIDGKESSSKIADADVSDNVCAKIETSEETGESCSTKLMNAEESLDREGPKEMQDESGDDICSFKRFDTAQDPLDHFFLDVNVPKNNTRKWLKKVQQDWNILQNNLPDGIYVRVYEDRMDLLRAVIVGAYGTPYQDGLFFFDFHLPPEYPDVPPSAHYHSGGWRLNPNLYEEGKVCLSLLNTWTGRGNEVWDPKSSSILQVLVSLQGLVLNSKPYFNEAGYDKQVGTAEGEKNSLSYNENTFLLSCKTMMYLMRKPPKDFDSLIKDHFKRRGYYILKACDIYMKGYLIGTLSEDASITNRSSADATSLGFKLMLAKIVPKLFAALSEVGANCSDFKHLQQQLL